MMANTVGARCWRVRGRASAALFRRCAGSPWSWWSRPSVYTRSTDSVRPRKTARILLLSLFVGLLPLIEHAPANAQQIPYRPDYKADYRLEVETRIATSRGNLDTHAVFEMPDGTFKLVGTTDFGNPKVSGETLTSLAVLHVDRNGNVLSERLHGASPYLQVHDAVMDDRVLYVRGRNGATIWGADNDDWIAALNASGDLLSRKPTTMREWTPADENADVIRTEVRSGHQKSGASYHTVHYTAEGETLKGPSTSFDPLPGVERLKASASPLPDGDGSLFLQIAGKPGSTKLHVYKYSPEGTKIWRREVPFSYAPPPKTHRGAKQLSETGLYSSPLGPGRHLVVAADWIMRDKKGSGMYEPSSGNTYLFLVEDGPDPRVRPLAERKGEDHLAARLSTDGTKLVVSQRVFAESSRGTNLKHGPAVLTEVFDLSSSSPRATVMWESDVDGTSVQEPIGRFTLVPSLLQHEWKKFGSHWFRNLRMVRVYDAEKRTLRRSGAFGGNLEVKHASVDETGQTFLITTPAVGSSDNSTFFRVFK